MFMQQTQCITRLAALISIQKKQMSTAEIDTEVFKMSKLGLPQEDNKDKTILGGY